jgi:5'-nucleotidase
MRDMNVVLSNDDGIYAPGIRAFYNAIKDLANVQIVAPSEEQSAVGHAITLFDPIKTKKAYKNGKLLGTAVSGTPADCVKLAICELCETPPDLVLSGINLGANTGISVLYSGTVSAATEATILGIPSIAVSLCTFTDPLWDTAETIARNVFKYALESKMPSDALLNVNIPNLPLEEIKGTQIVPVARSRFNEIFHKRTDPRGNLYYWLDGELEILEDRKETDAHALNEGYVTITPISFDLTNYAAMDKMRGWNVTGP